MIKIYNQALKDSLSEPGRLLIDSLILRDDMIECLRIEHEKQARLESDH